MNADQYRALSAFAEDVLTREARWKSKANEAKRADAGKVLTREKAGKFHFDLRLADMIVSNVTATPRARAAAAFMNALRSYGSELVWIDPRVTMNSEWGTITDDAKARHIAEICRTGNAFAKLLPGRAATSLLAQLQEPMHGDPWTTTTKVLLKGRSDAYAHLLGAPSESTTRQALIELVANLQLALRNEMRSNDWKRFAATVNQFHAKQRVSLRNSGNAIKPRRTRRTPLRRLVVEAFMFLRTHHPDITFHESIVSLRTSPMNGLHINALDGGKREISDDGSDQTDSESLTDTQLNALFKVALKEIGGANDR